MNDADIIKALECCKDRRCDICVRIDSGHNEECICRLELIDHALDLIKRQKAEIERLKWERDSTLKLLEVKREEEQREHNSILKELETINRMIPATLSRTRDEAIKEFAERLKEKKCHYSETEYTFDFDGVTVEDIDNLVKEMTEGKQ